MKYAECPPPLLRGVTDERPPTAPFAMLLLAIFLAFSFFANLSAHAETLCAKKRQGVKRGAVSLAKSVISVSGSCPKGYRTIIDIGTIQGDKGDKGDKGDTGNTGPAGTDGSLRIYGDGSGGALAVSTTITFTGSDIVPQYTDITIDSGVTLTVPSGTVFRCTGDFANNGTIIVNRWESGGRVRGGFGQVQEVAAGLSLTSATFGEFGDDSVTRFGGSGGVGLDISAAALLRYPGYKGGGGGAPGYTGGNNSISFLGADGGGTLLVLCKGSILNTGEIRASGQSSGAVGGGGAAGGVIILASPGSVTNTGTINANGGNGATSGASAGAGGGGGGGIYSVLSPVIAQNGTVNVAGGSAGTSGAAGSVTVSPRMAGSGGGGCGGNGGSGGSVTAADTPQAAVAGNTGLILELVADPTGLF